jgi:hypothetical protein
VANVHPGATLVPHFRDFLPAWVARQPWYQDTGTPSLSPVGYYRFEDPAGEVGVETHLVTDGSTLYQIPMTYRGSPMTNPTPDAAEALIATAEHSVLGTRWFYDGTADPVWRSELLRLVRTNGVSDPSGKRGVGPAEARGHLLQPHECSADTVTIDLRRVLEADPPADELNAVGVVTGIWHPDGPGSPAATGRLAVVRQAVVQLRGTGKKRVTSRKPG